MTLVKDRYEVVELLGSGGEARVVKALDRRHDRFVALKIRPAGKDDVRDDLLNEARVLLAVPPHPGLPLVREDFFDGDDYVVAMDWVDGTDLATLLRDRGRPGLAPTSVLAYLSMAAEALTHLHTQSPPIVHGDVKPANLILTRGGKVKLVDFGLSSAPNLPRRRTGTPGYRAPELAAGGPPSRASDIYALAATAFALLTGSAPAGILPSWEGIAPAQAEQFEAAIRLGMSTDPERRPATAGELVERLRAGWTSALPTGVVTFCMSDIEGSTALWDAHPEAMAQALVRHDELIVDAAEAHGGHVVQSMGEGDSTVSVFDSAPDAVAAALAANRAMAGQRWPSGIRIAVRWGLHTGEVERRGTEFRGPTIIVAARLRAQADGGQIFLSEVTSELVSGHLPAGCELVDLGPHRLKGVGRPERIRALKGPGVDAPLPATECPYRGLLAFEPDDRAFFFGREAVVADVLARLRPGRLLAVVGASGSGKSSVLRAGAVAAVRAGEHPRLRGATVLTPGAEPPLDLPDGPDQLVVIDQFEELFTLCDDAARRADFIAALLGLHSAVAIGMRADLYGRLSAHPELARAVTAEQVLLGAMTEVELERALTEPARLAGLKLEPGLVDLVLRDVAAEPGALPLLSHALRATWERRDGRTLTVEGYRESGGVASAIARTADAVVDALPAVQRQMTRSVFLRMTELGEGGQDSRRRVSLDELVPEGAEEDAVRALVGQLAEARLVMLDEHGAEVAHEALIRAWPRLRGWLDEDRAGIRVHRQLSHAARLWDSGGREPSDLYRGARLAAALELAQSGRGELNATERAFLDAGVEEADRDRRTQLRTNRRLRGLLAAAAVLLAVAIVAGVLSLVQRDHARTAESAARSQALTSDAERAGATALTAPSLDQAMLDAVAGVDLQDRPETRGSLLAVLQHNAAATHVASVSPAILAAFAVSPDGRVLATGDGVGDVRFLDLHTWRVMRAPLKLGQPVSQWAMAYAPNGHTLAVGTAQGASNQLDLIDVASRRVRHVAAWTTKGPGVTTLAYAPDGRLAVARAAAPLGGSTMAQTLSVLDSAGRPLWTRRYPMRRGQSEAHVAFTNDGRLVTSASQGDTLIWDVDRGRVVRRFPIGGRLALAPDDRHAALTQNSAFVGTPSSAIAILDLRSGRVRRLVGTVPDEWIQNLAYSRDGRELIGPTFTETKVWDLASGRVVDTYPGIQRSGSNPGVVVDPRGLAIVMAGGGGISAWDPQNAHRLARDLRLPAIVGLVVDPRGERMAVSQYDNRIGLYDLRTGRRLATLPPAVGQLTAMAFLPDGRLATAGENGALAIWDAAGHSVTRRLRFADAVHALATSPDGRLLAVQRQGAGADSHVEVRELATGRTLFTRTVRFGAGPLGLGALGFADGGRELVAAGCCVGGSVVTAFDPRTGAQIYSRTPEQPVTALAMSAGSRTLVLGTEDGRMSFWDARTARALSAPIKVAGTPVVQVALSPDRQLALVAARDGTVSLYDAATRKRVGDRFPITAGTIPEVLFEPDGRMLLVELTDAVEWPLDLPTLRRFACQVAGRGMTRAEWHELFPARAFRPVCA